MPRESSGDSRGFVIRATTETLPGMLAPSHWRYALDVQVAPEFSQIF